MSGTLTVRRWHLPLLVVTMLTMLLAACGGNTAATNTAAGSTARPATTTSGTAPTTAAGTTARTSGASSTAASGSAVIPKFDKPVTLEVFARAQAQEAPPPPADWQVIKAVKDDLNIDLKVTFALNRDDYTPQLQARAAANNLPDFFETDLAGASPTITSNLADQGLLADWATYLKSMPTYAADHDVAKLAQVGTFNGKQYGLVTKNPVPFRRVVGIRKDWLDKLGLQVPKTTEEFLTVMKAFTTRDPDGNGQNDTYGWSGAINADGSFNGFSPIFGAFGAIGDWRIDNGALVPVSTSPEMQDALKFINRMNQEGVIDPNWKAQKALDFFNRWKSGKIGIFYSDWCALYCAAGYSAFIQANPTGNIQIIDPPVGPTGKSAVDFYSAVGQIYAMSKKAADGGKGEAVARLLEWLNGPGYYITGFGAEGSTWHREGGKVVPGPKPSLSADNLTFIQLGSWTYKGTDEEFHLRFDNVTTYPNGQTVDVVALLDRTRKLAFTDITQFGVLPPPPADKAADLLRTIAQDNLAFASGQKPFTDWDAHVKTVKSVGLDDWQKLADKRARDVGLIK